MWNMRVTRQRISSQRKPPWKGSQQNIQHPGISSKRKLMPSPPNSGKTNGITATLERTSTSSFQRSGIPQFRGQDQTMFAKGHGPFQIFPNRISLRTDDCCCCEALCTSQPDAAL
ncbi:hypothetical protein AVEN_2213-1 [Araneus ventricosus]|uniref:Uncharacterized protein n=1 Tax=Araneus ventricosus TaxID=182803 RepID=A0A4Y2VFR9_ARAVE|nr:hypothetical protein AVEN_2213-1 [Araneus ventricosus]